MNAIGHRIIKLDTVPSTNSFLIELTKEYDVPQGTIILTNNQSQGRGQSKNFWESGQGLNLTFSFLLYPHFLNIKRQFEISKVVTLGISDVLTQLGISDVGIKWPNDIYIKDKKVCGILIETSLLGNTMDNSVIGVGLNVNQTRFLSDAPNPISICQVIGKEMDLTNLLNQLSDRLNYWYKKLYDGFDDEIDLQYASRLFRKSGFHTFAEKGMKFKAKIIGVNEIGQLVLEKENGDLKSYHFKEVEFILEKQFESGSKAERN